MICRGESLLWFVDEINPEEAQFAFAVLESDGNEFTARAPQDVANVAYRERGEADEGDVGIEGVKPLASLDESFCVGGVENRFGVVGEFARGCHSGEMDDSFVINLDRLEMEKDDVHFAPRLFFGEHDFIAIRLEGVSLDVPLCNATAPVG